MASRRRLFLLGLIFLAVVNAGCTTSSGTTIVRNVRENGVYFALGAFFLALLGFLLVVALMALERKYQVLASLGLRSLLLQVPLLGKQLGAGQQLHSAVQQGKSLKRQFSQDLQRNRTARDEATKALGNMRGKAGEIIEDVADIITDGPDQADALADERAPAAATAIRPEAAATPAATAPRQLTINRLPVPAEFVTAPYLLKQQHEENIVGRRLGRYQLEARHTQTDLGHSYHAFDLKLGRPVLLTVLNPALTQDPGQQTALLAQIRHAAQADQPSLNSIYDFELAEGYLFIVAAAVVGQPLLSYWQSWQQAGKPIGYGELLRLVGQVADALAYGEDMGLHHGQLTPDQLYWEADPAAPGFAAGRMHIHNFGYRLCELEAARHACQQADLVACGRLLYQLVTGEPVAASGELTAPARLRPGIPVDVEEIILDTLSSDPAERPATLAALADLLREVADSLGDRLMSGTELREGEPVIRVRAAGEADRLIRLNRDTYYIGQENRNDLLLPGHGVAPVHARLDRGPAGWEISDLGSPGGTHLADARLLPNLPEPWLPGQTLFLGPYQLNITTASAPELTVEAPVATAIGAALLPQAARVLPGERVDFQLSLVNQGNQVDHVSLVVNGVPEQWVSVSDTQLELMPGARGYLLVTVAPPRQSEATAGEYPVALSLQSAAARGQCANVTGLLTVGEFDQLQLDLHPEHLINEGVSRLQIMNQGNGPIQLDLAGRDSEAALAFTVADRETWELAAGASTTIDVHIRAQQRPFFGTQQRIPFELLLDANEERHFQNGQLLLTPRLPSWVLAAGGMSVAFICLVLGFIGNILLSNQPVALAAEVEATATALQQAPIERETADALGAITASSGLPQSCRHIRQQNGSANAPDGEYTLYVAGDADRPVAIYCHDMAGSAREYITLDTVSSGGNFSTIRYPDQQLRTTYLKVRFDLQTLRIDPTDRSFALIEGSLPSQEQELINDYGSAIGCSEMTGSDVFGEANINLTGTPFVLAAAAEFIFDGPAVDGAATLSDDRTAATITVRGNCGWAVPQGQIPLTYVGARN